MCGVLLVAGRSGGKRYTMMRMERGVWGVGGRETVKRKRKLSAVFLQPIQNPSYRLLQEGVGGEAFISIFTTDTRS
jgi:hypothetical protein